MAGDQDAFKAVYRAARALAGWTSDVDVATAAGINSQTISNWFGSGTHRTTPQGNAVHKVAAALRKRQIERGVSPDRATTFDELMAAYEGRPPRAPALHESIRELVTSLDRMTLEIEKDRASRDARDEVMLELVAAVLGPEARRAAAERLARAGDGR